ncbi:MAG TPA: ABC transporter substrate-binding protein [Holophagaceae bacterium]|nr:ABC transporter substrate-binding protein [Holophagaceae bacterium]
MGIPAPRFRRVAAAFAAALLLSGCRPAPRPDMVAMAWESFPLSLDPRYGQDQASQRLLALTHQALLRKDARLDLRPDACAAWSWERPYTVLRFDFAPEGGLPFPDGHRLSASDALDSLQALRDPAVHSPKAAPFQEEIHELSLEREGGHDVLRIALKSPDPGFPANLVRGVLAIAPKGARGEGLPGTGPYLLRDVIPEQRILLTVKRGHPDVAAHAHPQDLELRLMPDATTRALALRHGTVQLCLSNLPPDLLRPDPSFRVQRIPGVNQEYLAFQCAHPILKDPRVRWALSLAIDRRELVAGLRGGMAREAWSFYPPELAAGVDAARELDLPADPRARRARAEALLDDAGFPRRADGLRFRLRLSSSLDAEARMKALALQDQWARIGVGLEVRTREFGTLLGEVAQGRFEVVSLRWVGVTDPDMLDRTFRSDRRPPDGFNRGAFADAEADALLGQARSADPAGRLALLKRAQVRLVTQAPYAMLWWPDQVAALAPGVDLDLDGAGEFSVVWRD